MPSVPSELHDEHRPVEPFSSPRNPSSYHRSASLPGARLFEATRRTSAIESGGQADGRRPCRLTTPITQPRTTPTVPPATAAGMPSSKVAAHAVAACTCRPTTSPTSAPAPPASSIPANAQFPGDGCALRSVRNSLMALCANYRARRWRSHDPQRPCRQPMLRNLTPSAAFCHTCGLLSESSQQRWLSQGRCVGRPRPRLPGRHRWDSSGKRRSRLPGDTRRRPGCEQHG